MRKIINILIWSMAIIAMVAGFALMDGATILGNDFVLGAIVFFVGAVVHLLYMIANTERR